MGRSKRKHNLERIESNSELMLAVKRDNNRNLAYVPAEFISSTDAQRAPYFLTVDDLEELKRVAVYAEKRGQPGIFYPPGEIRALSVAKKSECKVTKNMISEATIVKQLPKNMIDLAALRQHGVKGRKQGHKGRPTLYYTQDDIENTLGIKVLTNDAKEGVDFIRETCVPIDIKLNLDIPTTCIKSQAGMKAELCYLQPEVEKIINQGGYVGPKMRRSERVKKPLNTGLGDCGYESIPHFQGPSVAEYQNAGNTDEEYSSSELAAAEDLNTGGAVGAYSSPEVPVVDLQIQGHTVARFITPEKGLKEHNSADPDENLNCFCD